MSSLSNADNLRVRLSTGFEDRMRVVCLSHDVDSVLRNLYVANMGKHV